MTLEKSTAEAMPDQATADFLENGAGGGFAMASVDVQGSSVQLRDALLYLALTDPAMADALAMAGASWQHMRLRTAQADYPKLASACLANLTASVVVPDEYEKAQEAMLQEAANNPAVKLAREVETVRRQMKGEDPLPPAEQN